MTHYLICSPEKRLKGWFGEIVSIDLGVMIGYGTGRVPIACMADQDWTHKEATIHRKGYDGCKMDVLQWSRKNKLIWMQYI